MKKEDKKKMLKGGLITILVFIPISFFAYGDIIFTLWYIPISIIQVSIVIFIGVMINKLIKKIRSSVKI